MHPKPLVLECPVAGCDIKIVIPYTVKIQPEVRDFDVTFDTSVLQNHLEYHKEEQP